MGAIPAYNAKFILLGIVVLAFVSFGSYCYIGSKKMGNAAIQSARWVLVGIVIGATVEFLQAAEILGWHVVTGLLALSALMIVESVFLKLEDLIDETSEKETDRTPES